MCSNQIEQCYLLYTHFILIYFILKVDVPIFYITDKSATQQSKWLNIEDDTGKFPSLPYDARLFGA